MTAVYDGFGRLSSSTLVMDGVSRTLTHLYDAAGNRTRITHPDAQAFTFAHDALGRLTAFYQGIGTSIILGQFAYDARGLVASRIDRPGSNVTYGYDPIGRLTNITDAYTGGTGNVVTGLAYNPAGQIVSRARSNDAYAWGGHYAVNRVYTADGLNRYSHAGSAAFAYDGNGNLISDGSRTYSYDVENRLVAASGPSVALRYDPLGRLYETIGPSGTTQFLYDGDALAGEYLNTPHTMTRRYVHGANAGADDPLIWYDPTVLHYLHTDHQGSIVAAANNSGTVVAINAYDEYGIPASTNQGRFQYTGQIWLPELGMYYYKARILSPTLGRFLQVDPIGYDDQFNLYAYVGNDPVNMVDPSGTYKCKGSSSECSFIRIYRRELGQAARSARPETGTRLMSSSARALIAVDRHIGDEGDGGVEISNASLRSGILGQTNNTTGNIQVDIAQIRRAEADGRTTGAGVIGHEGSHSLWRMSRGPITSLPDVMQMEISAYYVQSFTDQLLGARSIYWQPGMTDVQRRSIVRWGAHRSCADFANEVQPRQFPGQRCLP